MRQRLLIFLVSVVLVSVLPAGAAQPQLVILEAVPNTQTGVLTVFGVNFGATEPVVTLAGQTLTVQSFSDTELVVALSPLGPGTYLLEVARGPATVEQDTFSLTVGSSGVSGAITSVMAGPGLLGGGATGDVTLEVDANFLDDRYARLDIDNTFLGSQWIHGQVVINDNGVPDRPTLQVETHDPDVFVIESWSYATTGSNRAISGNTSSPNSSAVNGTSNSPTGGIGVAADSYGIGGSGVLALASATSGGGAAVHATASSPNGHAGWFRNNGGGRILTGVGLDGEVFYVENDGTVRAQSYTDLQGNPIGGTGDVTAVFAGPGLTGGGDAGDLSLGLDEGYLNGAYLRSDGSNNGLFARLDIDNFFQGSQTFAGATNHFSGFNAPAPSSIEFAQPDSGALAVGNYADTGCNRAITGNVNSECAAAIVGNALGPSGGTGGAFESRGDGGVGMHGTHTHPRAAESVSWARSSVRTR